MTFGPDSPTFVLTPLSGGFDGPHGKHASPAPDEFKPSRRYSVPESTLFSVGVSRRPEGLDVETVI